MCETGPILPESGALSGSDKSSPIEIREHFEIIGLYSIVTVQEEGYSSEVFQIIPDLKKEEENCKKCDYYISDISPLGLACMGKHENDIVEIKTKTSEGEFSYTVTIQNVNNEMQEECLNRS